MFSQVPNDRTKLVVPEARIDRQAKIMEPELCFLVAGLYVDVPRFVTLI